MNKWRQSDMESVLQDLRDLRSELEFDEYKLYAVRFDSNGESIALVHREPISDRHFPDRGEWYYMISWMETTSYRDKRIITDGDIEYWANDGQSAWYGYESEYSEDKGLMVGKGGIYKLI
jgi:hypothetical protein